MKREPLFDFIGVSIILACTAILCGLFYKIGRDSYAELMRESFPTLANIQPAGTRPADGWIMQINLGPCGINGHAWMIYDETTGEWKEIK